MSYLFCTGVRNILGERSRAGLGIIIWSRHSDIAVRSRSMLGSNDNRTKTTVPRGSIVPIRSGRETTMPELPHIQFLRERLISGTSDESELSMFLMKYEAGRPISLLQRLKFVFEKWPCAFARGSM